MAAQFTSSFCLASTAERTATWNRIRKLLAAEPGDNMATNIAPLNRQARVAGHVHWINYGNVGLIEAAHLRAQSYGDSAVIEVRDTAEPDSILTFRMTKRCEYVCENPRQGMVDE